MNIERPRTACLVLLLPLLAGACSLAPSYQRPAAPIPLVYERQDAAIHGQLPEWRTYFSDPDLSFLIEQALSHNRDLRSSLLRVEEARAIRGIQRAELFPSVDGQASAVRSRTARDRSLSGRAETETLHEATVGLTGWELDFWGRVRSLDQAALEEYFASEAAQRAFAISLVAEVANTWLEQREYDRRIDLANQAIQTREESHRIFKRRYEVGSSTRLELTQVEVLLVQAQALGVQLQQAREISAHKLALLVGGPVDRRPRSMAIDGLAELWPVAHGLPSDLLVNRPDIVAAEHRLLAAHANIGAARAAFFPRISLTGDYGYASLELDKLFAGPNRTWTFAPSLSAPIFQGGRLRRNLDLAEVRRDLAVAAYEKTIQEAFREVSDALSARHGLSRQLQILRQGLVAQRERARLAQLRYSRGATNYLDVLDAQRDLLQVEQEVVSTHRQLLSSQVNLFAALGGGCLGQRAGAASGSRSDGRPIDGTEGRSRE